MQTLSTRSLVARTMSERPPLSIERDIFGVRSICRDEHPSLRLRPHLESLAKEPDDGELNLRIALALARLARRAYRDTPPVSDVEARLRGLGAGGRCDRFELEGDLIRSSGLLQDTEVFIAHNAHNEIVIAFRGTETSLGSGALRDILTDLGVVKVTYRRRRKSGGRANRLHRKFYRAYRDVQGTLVDRVRKLVDRLDGPTPRLFFTGHSLGGALATIAAIDFAVRADDGDDALPRQNPVTLYTFGSPRVLSLNMVRNLFNPLVPRSFAVLNEDDPVGGLPPVLQKKETGTRYSHIDPVVVLRKDGAHEVRSGDSYRGEAIPPGGHGIAHYVDRLEKAVEKAVG